ncbi:MAG: hypothetical protein KIT84_43450 [Labilithrix sp.]|nr:hypothetical protein [Labilithrix sp.]MCW5817935.1 hypothetical protein [Labilithrix sp.]
MLRRALVAAVASLVAACSGSSSDTLLAPDAPTVDTPAAATPPSEPGAPSDSPAPPGEAPPDVGAGAPPLGGEVGKWTWLEVPESKCGNGEATGIGVNLGAGGAGGAGGDLVIFLMGGGGCWDELTCNAGAAKNVKDGYQRDDFEADVKEKLARGIFDRAAANNPFKDSSFVAVPYCTGDVHAGDATKEFFLPRRTMHFSGRKNVEAMLGKVVPAFAGASRVTLAGVSAGGFGAAINYWRVQDAFGATRVDLVDDSGPPFESGHIPLLGAWRSAWNLDAALPPDCAGCKENLAAIPAHYAKKYPSSRMAFTSFDQDKTISLFFVTPQPLFASRLRGMAETRLAPLVNFRFFIVPGTEHTMLDEPLDLESGTTALGDWLTTMKADAPAWTNVAAK